VQNIAEMIDFDQQKADEAVLSAMEADYYWKVTNETTAQSQHSYLFRLLHNPNKNKKDRLKGPYNDT